jgi:bifunctional enzyme CysN/CysC
MTPSPPRQRINVVIGGHVDHGKSTLVGRLLADSGALPEGKLEQVRALCERTGRPFEYAFLLDALKDERAQGITIDTARVFFSRGSRDYLLLDAPGHVEFVRNLVTGAAHADAAMLVLDAQEGIRDNSRRHGYLMSLLGIRQLAVVINKLDLVDYSESVFARLSQEYARFLESLGLTPAYLIPVSAREGVNLTGRSPKLPWYGGPTLLDALEAFAPTRAPVDGPFRMPVQDVYKFTGDGDDRRIVAGTIESGTLRPGDEVVFYPSGKRARVRSLEAFARPAPLSAQAGEAAGFTLEEQIYVTRGELATLSSEPRPSVALRLKTGLFWLGKRPLTPGRDYLLKLGTSRVPMRVESIQRSLDAASLEVRAPAEAVRRHEIAECILELGRPLATDTALALPGTSRFVIVDDFEIAGGGRVHEALPDAQMPLREKVRLRNYKWETSFIPVELRAARYAQRPTLLLITGPREADRKQLAKAVEARLFEAGHVVYYIGMANLLYGVDADLAREAANRAEHLRRLAEIANLLLDAGVILVVSAAELDRQDLELIRTAAPPDRVVTVWLGGPRGGAPAEQLEVDLTLDAAEPVEQRVERLRELLAERGAFLDVP